MITKKAFFNNHFSMSWCIAYALKRDLSHLDESIAYTDESDQSTIVNPSRSTQNRFHQIKQNFLNNELDTFSVMADPSWIMSEMSVHEDSTEGFNTASVEERINQLVNQ